MIGKTIQIRKIKMSKEKTLMIKLIMMVPGATWMTTLPAIIMKMENNRIIP